MPLTLHLFLFIIMYIIFINVFLEMFCAVYTSIMLIYNVHNVQWIGIWKSHRTIKFLSLSLFVSEGNVVPLHTMNVYKKSGNIAPPILYLGIRCRWVTASRLGRFTLWETAPNSYWTGGSMCSRSGLEGLEKTGNVLTPMDSNPLS
jgi:hypothetical protein